MKSLWSAASELTERAKTLAGDYLKGDPSLQKDIENFKKDTLATLDQKVKENEELLKKNKELSELNQLLNKKTQELEEKASNLEKDLILIKSKSHNDEQEVERLKKIIQQNEVGGLKDVILNNYNKMKIEINQFDFDVESLMKKLADIKNATDNLKSEKLEDIIKDTSNDAPSHPNDPKDTQDKPAEENKEEAPHQEDNANNEDNKQTNTNNNNGKKRRKKKKGKGNKKEEKEEPIEEGDKKDEKTQEGETQEAKEEVAENIQTNDEKKSEDTGSKKDEPLPKDEGLSETLINEISSKITSQISPLINSQKESLQKYLEDNIALINTKIDDNLSHSSEVNLENDSLKVKLTSASEKVASLESQLESETKSKAELEEELKKAEQSLQIEEEKSKKLEADLKTLQSSATSEEGKLSGLEKSNTVLAQTLKQLFLLLLEDDIFIDLIENSLKDPSDPQFFEKGYSLAKYIKPKIIHDYQKSFIINNKDFVNKANKYNLDTNLEEVLEKISVIKSLDDLLRDFSSESFDNDFICKLINELFSYVESLNTSIASSANKNIEMMNTIKSYEESKKNDVEKMLNLQNEIKSKNQQLTQIDTLTNENKKQKSEIDQLNNKINSLLSEQSNLNSEKGNYNEKLSLINQQCEVFKVENSELLDRISESKSEMERMNLKIEALQKENLSFKQKAKDFEQISSQLQLQDSAITIKDNEYKKLQNSYMELEAFLESTRKEKDSLNESYQSQITSLTKQNEQLKNEIKVLNDKISKEEEQGSSEENKKRLEEVERKLTEVEIENKSLKEQKIKLKEYSEEIVKRVQHDYKENEFLIDKRMISSILFKYFDPYTNTNIKYSLLETLANFMDYTNDERKQLGLSMKSGNEETLGKSNNKDKLKKLGEELYDFITNS